VVSGVVFDLSSDCRFRSKPQEIPENPMSAESLSNEMSDAELRAAIVAAKAKLAAELHEQAEMFQIKKVSGEPRHFEETTPIPPKRFRTPSKSPEAARPYVAQSPDGKPRAFGYARVSTRGQFDNDVSIPDQKIRMENYFRFQLEPKGVEFAGVFDDGQSKSARLKPFMSRVGVKTILGQLRQGDHFIIDKCDRAFRDTRDFLYCNEWFENNRINLHILNLGGQHFQPNSPMGRMFMTLVAGFAQLEAETTSARVAEACRSTRAKGHAWNNAPPGTKLGAITKNKTRRLVWDVEKRRFMALIVHMRDELYMDWRDITWELYLLRNNGKPPTTEDDRMRWANNQQQAIYNLYCYEHFYRDKCITDPAEIPYKPVVLAYGRIRKKEMTKIVVSERARARREAKAASRY